jgi:ABC-2 type transport system ATP-binding protein
MSGMVEVEGLGKIFVKSRSLRDLLLHPWRRAERLTALDGVDLQIGEGEILGILGPNGAGKTTLLKVLCGLLVPTTGRALVAGHDVVHAPLAVRESLGFVTSEERSFYWRLSGRENLHFFGRLSNVPGPRLAARCQSLLEQVEIEDVADRAFMTYSSGMKQRLAVARALLHDPPLLIMDEPTRSLDPSASRHLRELSVRLRDQQGKSVLLATHNLEEAEALCGRLVILHQGRIRASGTMEEMCAAGQGRERYLVTLSGRLQGDGGGYRIVAEEGKLSYTLELDRGGEGLTQFLGAALGEGLRVLSCRQVETPLQEVFDRVVGDGNEELG